MIFGIPTYKRVKQKTVTYLNILGYGMENIILSTQCKEDYETLKGLYKGKATVIFRPGSCVSDNRNAILDFAQTGGINSLVMLDDDISYLFSAINGKKNRIAERVALEKEIGRCVCKMNDAEAILGGFYCCSNPLMMSDTISLNALLIGTVLLIRDTDLRFDSRYHVKEDYELCCRLIRNGTNTMRFNNLAAEAEHRSKGGCEIYWENDLSGDFSRMLVGEYPDIVGYKKTKRGMEVKLVRK